MPDIPFPLSSTPGRIPGEGEGRLVNAYAKKEGDAVYWRRLPGLTQFASATGLSAHRGALEVNGLVYAVYSSAVVTIDAAGAVTTLTGTVAGSDGVTMARNNRVTDGASTPDIVVVRASGGAYTISGSTVAAYADADLPANVNSVSTLGPFFVFTLDDGRIFASDLNTTAINALSFATAESSPDGLVRGFTHGNRSYACGTKTIEVYSNQGLSPFPLQRFPTVISVGLLAPMAVAGFEEGWDRVPLFVASDGTVRELDGGFEAQPVSTPDVEAFIADSDPATLEALVYVTAGRPVWVLSSDVGSWGFDVVSRAWHERVSEGSTRWRATRSVKAFDRWLVGDRTTGKIGSVEADVRTEYGDPLTWQVDSAPLKAFPARVAIPAAFMHFTRADASVLVSWSHDGGESWAAPQVQSLVQADRYPVRQNRLGLSTHHGLRLRLSVASDVDFSFMGASVPKPGARAP